MPNPFPGMNPYLEEPGEWHSFHNGYIASITATLNHILPTAFAAKIEIRCYILSDTDPGTSDPQRVPDTLIYKTARLSQSNRVREGGTAALDYTLPTGMALHYPIEEREAFIEIISLKDKAQAVTIIELLSHANKRSKSMGHLEYKKKQQDILNSTTNLVEIDLLRAGSYTVAAPLHQVQAHGKWDYIVSLNRNEQRYEFPFWLMNIRDRLPIIPIPLTSSVPDVRLDLQQILNQWCDDGGFSRTLEYTEPIVPSLSTEDTLWAESLLRDAGLRP